MKMVLARFAEDESGATAIEYGLIVAVIGAGVIAGFSLLAAELKAAFAGLAPELGIKAADG